MDQTYVESNAAALGRLRALMEHVSDEELGREIEGGWTVSALLAHLAFWDRYAVARWMQAERNNQRVPLPTGKIADLVNDAAREGWLACPPRAAARQALAAADAINRLIAGLDADTVAEVVASGGPELIDRTRHWHDHLDEIEAALGRAIASRN